MSVWAVGSVAVGAGLGGALRFLVSGWAAQRWGAAFPWGTLLVNVSGSFLVGLLVAVSLERDWVDPSLRLFLGTGLLGGYTTFSSLSWDSLNLVHQGLWGQALLNMGGSVLLGLAAAAAGLWLGRLL